MIRNFAQIVLFGCLGWIGFAHSQQTPYRQPHVYAIQHARIVPVSQPVIEKGSIVIRNGVIEAVGPSDKIRIPADAVVIAEEGLTVYPGLIDSFTSFGLPAQGNDPAYAPSDRGNAHPNGRVRPERRAVELMQPDAAALATRRRAGITSAHIVPFVGIFSGQSALVSLGEGDLPQLVMHPAFAAVMNMRDRSRAMDEGFGGYPGSLMGSIALIRQTFYDTQHQMQTRALYEKDPKNKPRPATNRAYDALEPVLKGQFPLIVYANNAQDILRVIKIADEFKLKIMVAGGAEAAKVADVLASRKIPVLLGLEMPEAVRAYDPLSPPSLTGLRNRALATQNAALLHKAGVQFVFSTDGLSDPSSLRRNIKVCIDNGLPAEVALEALTLRPAKLFGVDKQIGSIETGKAAHLVVTKGDLFENETQIRYVFVDGRETKIEATAAAPPAGAGPRFRPRDWDEEQTSSDSLCTSCCLVGADLLHEHTHNDAFDGLTSGAQPPRPGGGAGGGRRGPPGASGSGDPPDQMPKVSLEPMAPPPADAHNSWLLRNATIWTLGPQGTLTGADMLVENGKIKAVGKNLSAPAGVRIVDATGKHIIPGIIDCHSHTAISGGVNEGSNVCTAEVRIEDVINPDDVNIYRQLAGGTTGANLLHGSANVIGGQNAVIKFRWGKRADEMLFKEAPKGIKFALGENVKRSNFGGGAGGGGTTRYPGSRMGVEQVVRERFLSALDYKRQQDEFKAGKRPYPPARDLQLDALVEILEGKRLIHCHSYRQDEILMLIRLCEEFGVKIATFQHVLEGYKVADEIAKHGAGGSTFSDWWAFKIEAFDAIPYNAALMNERGVVVTLNSDSSELARRMNLEAAKAVKYGGVNEEDALKMVTLNAAMQLGVDRYVGSLEAGKHADFSVWNENPLSVYAKCEKTYVDGVLYFDLNRDQDWQRALEAEKQTYLKSMRAVPFYGSAEEPKEDATETPAEQPKPAGGIAGVWRGKITGESPLPPEGVEFTLTLQVTGNTLSGTLSTPLGENTFSNLPYDPNASNFEFSFNIPNGPSAQVQGTVSGDSMTGTVSIFGQAWQMSARRVSPNNTSNRTLLIKPGAPVTQAADYAITNAVIHPLTAPVIDKGTVLMKDGKIVAMGADIVPPATAKVYDAKGLHLYPGMFDANSRLGLSEIGSINATIDTSEIGSYNPNARVEIAINPDSAHIPVARANGITQAFVTPEGGTISGMGCVIQTDGWTWEDLCIPSAGGMLMSVPSPSSDGGRAADQRRREWQDSLKPLQEYLENTRRYLRAKEAAGKDGLPLHEKDVRYEAMIPVLKGEVPIIVRANNAIGIRAAVEWAEKEKFKIIILGGSEAHKIADFLSEKKVPVILGQIHTLPSSEDTPYSQPFSHPKILSDAGVLFCISTGDSSNARNLPYQAAMAAAFGLSREEALKAVTLYPAQILGLGDQLGSIEVGKRANLILTTGDPLEIRTEVKQVFIEGRPSDMSSKHTRLYDKYRARPRK